MTKVYVIDYGSGNLMSVQRALEYCGAEVVITTNPKDVRAAERLMLPGVGAFGDCMDSLAKCGMIEPILEFAESGRPFLGVCVGMQVLFDKGEEYGVHAGLGLIPGSVRAIPREDVAGRPHKLPHIGWSALVPPAGQTEGCWKDTILDGVSAEDAVYFAHSFMGCPEDDSCRLANTTYGGHTMPAVVRRGNVMGLQFHPEKSGEIGLKIVRNFLK